MRILVCGALAHAGARTAAACVAVKRALAASGAGDVVVVSMDDLDWEALRAQEGGWQGAYQWAARAHDGVVAIEHARDDGSYSLSAGVYAIAASALGYGRAVYVERAGALFKVARVVERDKGDRRKNWKTDFGRAVIA